VEHIIDADGHHVVELTRELRVLEQPAVHTEQSRDSAVAERDQDQETVAELIEHGNEAQSEDVQEPDKREGEFGLNKERKRRGEEDLGEKRRETVHRKRFHVGSFPTDHVARMQNTQSDDPLSLKFACANGSSKNTSKRTGHPTE
jgi:hypothetical protein